MWTQTGRETKRRRRKRVMAAISSNVKLSGTFMLVVVLVGMMVLASTPTATAAVSCNTVNSKLMPCLGYVTGSGIGAPSATCCSGMRTLYASLKVAADRQAACRCIKTLTSRFANIIKLNVIKTLPNKCGINLPYTISPSINCDKLP
ncbi:non-specific lipid-transfer protein-like isoform X3 [Nymphaea colorata]|uniref:non-specific lipid-transfer protein-like isoform X3 n=1 Tax=Nymphaea colorata TaxID=210225 RepID=UPI00129EB824|nr:non-specific lipid-transfer protein-like isoform X3 [Nymphaea colorata]